MIPPVRRFVPCAAPVSALAKYRVTITWLHQLPGTAVKMPLSNGPRTIRPMKPHTMEGMAASSSITIFSVSFTFPFANSEI